MNLLFCDIIYVVIPGQWNFIYDHTKIFHVVLYEYVAVRSVLFVFGITGSGYVKDTTFLEMELHLPCFCQRSQFV